MAILTPTPKQQFIDANGDPYAGGKVYTYEAGTTTPLPTYTDQGGGTPNPNPVILDTAGRAAIWLTSGSSYKFVVTDANDVSVMTVDDIISPIDSTAANTWTADQTFQANIIFSGNGRRIKGDFSNATVANRVLFQTTTASGATEVGAIPNSGSNVSGWTAFSDATNGAYQRMSVSNAASLLEVGKIGSGSYVPWALNVAAVDRIGVDTSGVFTIANPVAFSVNRAGSGTFTCANNTVTAVDWTAADFDTNSSFDLTTDRFTPPAGYYHLSGCATGGWIDSGSYVVAIYKNGTAFKNGNRPDAGSSSSGAALVAASIAVTVHASGTDYFDFRVYQANPAAGTVTYVDDAVQLYFCGHRVG